MSEEKRIISARREASPPVERDEAGELRGAKKPVEILSLSIDDSDDRGGDPYNHTGSFCVPDFDKD